MPQFYPDFSPSGLSDFATGYLECAEWTDLESLSERWLEETGTEMPEIQGWSPDAIKQAVDDCTAFESSNAEDLATYYAISGRNEGSAGHDFWLSRNGHGAGYFDRGNDPVFDRLQSAARTWSSRDVYVSDSGHLELS